MGTSAGEHKLIRNKFKDYEWTEGDLIVQTTKWSLYRGVSKAFLVKVFTETNANAGAKEAKVFNKLNHDNLASVLAHGTFKSQYVIIWEFFGQQTLKSLLKGTHGLNGEDFARLATAISKSLRYLQENGIVHCLVTTDTINCGLDSQGVFTFKLSGIQCNKISKPPGGIVRRALSGREGKLSHKDDLVDMNVLCMTLFEAATGKTVTLPKENKNSKSSDEMFRQLDNIRMTETMKKKVKTFFSHQVEPKNGLKTSIDDFHWFSWELEIVLKEQKKRTANSSTTTSRQTSGRRQLGSRTSGDVPSRVQSVSIERTSTLIRGNSQGKDSQIKNSENRKSVGNVKSEIETNRPVLAQQVSITKKPEETATTSPFKRVVSIRSREKREQRDRQKETESKELEPPTVDLHPPNKDIHLKEKKSSKDAYEELKSILESTKEQLRKSKENEEYWMKRGDRYKSELQKAIEENKTNAHQRYVSLQSEWVNTQQNLTEMKEKERWLEERCYKMEKECDGLKRTNSKLQEKLKQSQDDDGINEKKKLQMELINSQRQLEDAMILIEDLERQASQSSSQNRSLSLNIDLAHNLSRSKEKVQHLEERCRQLQIQVVDFKKTNKELEERIQHYEDHEDDLNERNNRLQTELMTTQRQLENALNVIKEIERRGKSRINSNSNEEESLEMAQVLKSKDPLHLGLQLLDARKTVESLEEKLRHCAEKEKELEERNKYLQTELFHAQQELSIAVTATEELQQKSKQRPGGLYSANSSDHKRELSLVLKQNDELSKMLAFSRDNEKRLSQCCQDLSNKLEMYSIEDTQKKTRFLKGPPIRQESGNSINKSNGAVVNFQWA